MNKKIKENWIKDLRSSQQTTKGLRFANKYCVMGLLCNLHKIAFNNDWIKIENELSYKYLGEISNTPAEVLIWAGLPYNEHLLVPIAYKRKLTTLQSLNDSGVMFSEIAKLIDEQF